MGKKHKERNYFMIKYILQILLNATLLKSFSSVKYQYLNSHYKRHYPSPKKMDYLTVCFFLTLLQNGITNWAQIFKDDFSCMQMILKYKKKSSSSTKWGNFICVNHYLSTYRSNTTGPSTSKNYKIKKPLHFREDIL